MKYLGTFGQPKLWDINQEVSYQHPMVPYDVLVDPLSVPKHPIFNDHDTNDEIVEVDEVKHEVQSVDSTVSALKSLYSSRKDFVNSGDKEKP